MADCSSRDWRGAEHCATEFLTLTRVRALFDDASKVSLHVWCCSSAVLRLTVLIVVVVTIGAVACIIAVWGTRALCLSTFAGIG